MTKKERQDRMARRRFLGKVASGVLAGGMLSTTTRARSARASSAVGVWPSERIVLGFIGLGGMGRHHLNGFKREPDVAIAACCDVHAGRRALAVKRTGGRAVGYNDYRHVLDRPDIDAVVIATPDHWHAKIMVDACQAGKDVYVEKPISLTIAEGRAMVEAARRYGRIVQVGIQQRSAPHIQQAVRLIQEGRIGTVTMARTWIDGGASGGAVGAQKPPPELDWDMWLGPAPWVPYHPDRFNNFRAYRDYSGGAITDWGTHLIDVVHWAMKADAPLAISASGLNRASSPTCDMPDTFEVVYEYPGFIMTWSQQLGRNPENRTYGMQFFGTKGSIFIDRELYIIYPEGKEVHQQGLADSFLSSVQDHRRNFLDSVKSRKKPIADIEIGHRSTSAPHLGNIAYLTGRKLRWNAEAERFVDDPGADRFLFRPYRAPWRL